MNVARWVAAKTSAVASIGNSRGVICDSNGKYGCVTALPTSYEEKNVFPDWSTPVAGERKSAASKV